MLLNSDSLLPSAWVSFHSARLFLQLLFLFCSAFFPSLSHPLNSMLKNMKLETMGIIFTCLPTRTIFHISLFTGLVFSFLSKWLCRFRKEVLLCSIHSLCSLWPCTFAYQHGKMFICLWGGVLRLVIRSMNGHARIRFFYSPIAYLIWTWQWIVLPHPSTCQLSCVSKQLIQPWSFNSHCLSASSWWLAILDFSGTFPTSPKPKTEIHLSILPALQSPTTQTFQNGATFCLKKGEEARYCICFRNCQDQDILESFALVDWKSLFGLLIWIKCLCFRVP